MDQCNLCDDNKSKVTISNPSDSPTIPPSKCTNPIPSIDLTDDTTIVIAAPSKHEVNSILKKQPNKRRKRKNKSNPSTKPTKIRFDPKFVAPTPEEQDRIIQQTVHKEDSLPNNVPVKEEIGKCNVKLMKPQKRAEEHPVTPLLHTYADDGCPVDCGEPWSLDHILAMLERGPHISAKSKEAIIQLRAETLDKQKYGYAKVVKWKDIKDNLPLNFKLSPVAMIPHKSRKFRCILDLSFQLFYKGSRLPSVNGQTNKKAVQEAMHQLGSALKRIVATMVDNYEENVSYLFTKIDIKDGYWRMAVSNNDAWNFCYVLPSLQDNIDLDDIEIVVPNSLQMGWSESPPYFCSATETARDIIQELLSGEVLPEHKFEHKMLGEQINNEINSSPLLAVNLLEVFVDDFIAMTNNNNYQHLQHFSRAIIHGVHSIFPPPHVSGHNGFDPVSKQKLDKGEGNWSTKKELLGWDFDGENMTIQLPPKKIKAICEQLKTILKKQNVTLNTFQKLAGRLQHASFGIPGGNGLFSPIQAAMRNDPEWIKVSEELKIILQDWRYIVKYMGTHPTSLFQLVPQYPSYIGYTDACFLGCGGVWCSGLKSLEPCLWQYEWPEEIKAQIQTPTNPKGLFTINDLELLGQVLGWLILETLELSLKYEHVGIFCDNQSAVEWVKRLRTSTSRTAGRLLRLLGLRIHARMTSSVTPLHIAGELNRMADIISRAFKTGKFFMNDLTLVDYFNQNFPLPQNKSWTHYQLPNEWTSRVIALVLGEPLQLASLLRLPKIKKNIGVTGTLMQPCAKLTHGSEKPQHSAEISSSPLSLHGSGEALTVEDLKSMFRASLKPSRPSARPSKWLDSVAPFIENVENDT